MTQSLDEIMSGREAAPVEQQDQFARDAERAANSNGADRRERDEQGRFARQEQQEQPGPKEGEGDQPEPDRRQRGDVPKQALEAERRKRQERDDELTTLRRELAEVRGAMMARQQPQALQQPAHPEPPPQFWENPDAATDYRLRQALDPVQQQLQQQTLVFSHRLAEVQHGPETVNEALQALGALRQSNPRLFAQLDQQATASRDPVGDVVRWHKNQRALSEIGDDPAAYRERVRQELMAEFQQGQDQPQPPPAAPGRPPLPTSFPAVRPGAPRGGGGYGGPKPLSEIMGRG